ncbi:ABC transporter ATP-binding protein/permease [Clostridium gasigenes]|uniref:ABC transporter ATP-binding protein/permease n=1 Tax=Clostridium gasigenes TaxID=94869 RepID=UPI00162AC180|nr:ABC transporter ATP-binding protein/permease [Clostridium gasigenes]MBB6622891.1 ABC transporter ATP-binding protein/permease [Clostridium gasigenes]MBU3089342.1 ABC transporter ATP-binding protein/permease [Clostridium gasigenes]
MITLKNLSKNFDESKIYSNTNYSFKGNSFTCFLGPSGSGKTTLLNLIAGFDRDYSGDIIIDELNINSLSMDELCKYRFNNVGFIFQQYNLLKGYTSLENVLMGIHLNDSISEKEKERRAVELLTKLGLKGQINQSIETLSGGEKQRVAIARALVNNPKIILADEPTGALDSEATKSIMEILKEISKDRIVVVITHDEEVAAYADEVIELDNFNIKVYSDVNIIENKNLEYEDKNLEYEEGNDLRHKGSVEEEALIPKLSNNTAMKLSLKNFKIHMVKFIVAALIIAFGSVAFVGALASKNITNNLINEFKEKNIFYNKGQVPVYDNGKIVNEDIKSIFNKLNAMDRVEDVYYQYKLENLKIIYNNKNLDMIIKVPTATSKETMAYGDMPRDGSFEIVISSNIANRMRSNIEDIIGEKIYLEYSNKNNEIEKVELTVSGLSNSSYQDFIVSTDVEKDIYGKYNIDENNPAAVSFDVKNFNDILSVDKELKADNISVFTKSLDIKAFQDSFTSLIKLYTVLSYLILIIGILISVVMLYKISIERYKEVGLLGALGYSMRNMKKIMVKESLYFSALSIVTSILLFKVLDIVYVMQFGYKLDLNVVSYLILMGLNLVLTVGISYVINMKLIKTEPAVALRK